MKIKRVIALAAASVMLAGAACAEVKVDLSGMSYQELVELKDAINLAMWQCDEWQEVEVPQGVWKVGEDIPAGHWTVKTISRYTSTIAVGTVLNTMGKRIDVWSSPVYYYDMVTNENNEYFDKNVDKSKIDIVLKDGMYVIIEDGDVVFTPYDGKPSLGFK